MNHRINLLNYLSKVLNYKYIIPKISNNIKEVVEIINILKATRIYRTIPVLMIILIPAAFSNILNTKLFILGLCCVLVYASAGIHNAIKDKDYDLPKYSSRIIIFLLIGAIIISLFNYIIFLTVLLWIFLGYIYNTFSRYVLFGDTSIIAFTHFSLPLFSSSLLLGLNYNLAFKLSIIFFIIAWFITQTKNLKDTKEDKKREYVTLTTRFQNGILITKILLFISFVFMIISTFIFDLNYKITFSFVLMILILIFSFKKINNKQTLKLLRLVMLIFILGIIFDKTSNYLIITFSITLFTFYVLYLLVPYLNKIKIIENFRGVLNWNQK